MNYDETVRYIEEIPKFTKKTTLDHTRIFLNQLGNPEKDLKIIHVAGTNGKGSTCAYLDSMLQKGGYKVGLFTSPHLIRMNERFMINGEPVSDEMFIKAFQLVKEASDILAEKDVQHPTYFETVLLMGMLIFSWEKVDYLVLETGLGGRLDATNVVDNPLATIIVSISRDHTEYLGETIPEIAGEKAGIIKKGVPIIFDGQNEQASRVIEARAKEMGSPAFTLTSSMYEMKTQTKNGIRFAFRYPGEEEVLLSIPYLAEYQMMNASLAYFTMKTLSSVHGISNEKLLEGLHDMKWPGRMEMVLDNVILDGAHNEDGVAQFVNTVAHFKKDYRITLLFSAVADKRYSEMIRELVEGIHPDEVITTQIMGSREVSAERLAEIFRENGLDQVSAKADIGEAFDLACERKGDGMLFCVGSLYLVGELKHHIQTRV